MTDDEIVTLGSFCETLLGSDAWRVIVDQFEQQCFQHMMSTEAHETKKLEGVFATYQGVRDFLAHMNAIVAQKDKILAPQGLPEWAPQAADTDD